MTYRVTAPLTGLPEKARVFKFDKPEVTLTYAKRVAAAFGFNGEPDVNPGETIGRFTFKKEAESLEIDSDGTIRYTQSIPRELEENPVGVPNDQRAISLAAGVCCKNAVTWGELFMLPSPIIRQVINFWGPSVFVVKTFGSTLVWMDALYSE